MKSEYLARTTEIYCFWNHEKKIFKICFSLGEDTSQTLTVTWRYMIFFTLEIDNFSKSVSKKERTQ